MRMPKLVTEIERQEKRRAILDSAAAEIAHFGFDRANINTIAERAGIGRGTIYLYFDSKDDVLGALLDTIGRVIDDIIQECIALDLPWPDRLQWLAGAFVSLAERHSDYFRVQLSALRGLDRDLSAPVSRWLQISVGRLSAALEAASLESAVATLPSETLATIVIGTLESFILLPGVVAQDDDVSARAQTLARVLWHGMAPD
jgi:AcrR family transcriptional regulator